MLCMVAHGSKLQELIPVHRKHGYTFFLCRKMQNKLFWRLVVTNISSFLNLTRESLVRVAQDQKNQKTLKKFYENHDDEETIFFGFVLELKSFLTTIPYDLIKIFSSRNKARNFEEDKMITSYVA